jgi:hypothetical protein
MSRTKRKHYKTGSPMRDGDSQRAAGSCNNHGGCPYCEGNRLHAQVRQAPAANEAWEPPRALMTQFRIHEAEGDGKFCERCGFHRENKLVHPQSPERR